MFNKIVAKVSFSQLYVFIFCSEYKNKVFVKEPHMLA